MDRLHGHRIFSTIGFFACWTLTAALVAYGLCAIAWESMDQHVELLRGIDDDWTFVAIPVGAVLGAWGARRTLRARRFQIVCIPAGLVVLLVGLVASLDLLAESRRLSGTGPFAGIGEAIAGVLFAGLAVAGGLIVGIGVCGVIATRAERLAEPRPCLGAQL